MESMLIGSLHRPFPFAAELCSLHSGNDLKCKAFSSVGRLYALPERLCVRRRNLMHQPVKNIIQRRITLNPKHDSKYVVNSASGHPLESEPSKNPLDQVKQAFDAFYRFSRPHTVIGTALSIVSVSLLAVEKLSDFSPLFFAGLLEAIVAALLMNIYIVGLNQISDIEIDKVNKPYLPLASGEYSVKTGLMIVSSFGILSFWLGWVVGSWPLFWALFISFILGTAYSIDVPLLRWKRFAVVAAMCIFAVRAVIVQIAFYLHIQTYVFGRPGILTKPVIFATAFMSFFSVVIALFKDIPDIVGDKIYGIQSFTVRLGQEKVFWICISLLEMAYAVALFVGVTSTCTWSKWATVIGHTALGYLLWSRAKSIDFKSKAAITSFYMFIWKISSSAVQLFYAEYLLIPLIR
ncbi:homogentisate phytyltransferase 1, chloroplastic-like isoform X2 [Salvia hispanica]|uniref:homogentisate phytyltransferase 1, chloroplastic-like isoform X2 n=1 Tax=Salvia hispanica TaxID=49212 RepID=UPI0020097E4A|nr:homogentisate phytyltransferase 1, chloroplastic-like isoform X2 [Salvia hispanica]